MTGERRHLGGTRLVGPGTPADPPAGRRPGVGVRDDIGVRDETLTRPGSGASAATAAGSVSLGGRLQRAALGMAAGTAVSRLTGLLRVVALAYALGATHVADAYNLANTTPNMLYDIVLGGVLAATFIPVFVDRLATRTERDAWRAISAVVTVSAVVLVAMTVVFWLLAPQVIDAYTAFAHAGGAVSAHELVEEKSVATTLLRWFVPQVAIYGAIALMTALLNTRRRFAAPMWVPIANNLVCIGVLLWFHQLVPNAPTFQGIEAHPNQLLLLGLGTTAGVAVQALLLLPSLRGAGLGRVRWRWDPRHEAVRTVLRLGGWTFGFVMANQVALYVVLALAVGAPGPDPVSAYTYAYTFMQMPYAVVAVSVMSAVTPDLSERWATGDVTGFRHRLAGGLRATLAVIVPASVGMLILAKPAVALLLGHGTSSVGATATTGSALALFSLGLPGFCTYLYVVRVLQSMQRTRIAFWLYGLENAINVVLAVALVHPLGVRGLALALSVSYSVAAVAGIAVLRRWLGELGDGRTWAPLRRVGGASLVMGLAVLVVSNLSGADHGVGLLLRVCGSVAAGVVVYAGVAVLLGGRHRPVAVLTGTALDDPTTSDGRLRPGPGVGMGTAWGDARVPVYTGPRVRIIAKPGAPPGPSTPSRPVDPRPVDPRRVEARPADPRRVEARPAPRPAGLRGGPDEAVDNDDDPGDRRWLGGTQTPLPPRPPR